MHRLIEKAREEHSLDKDELIELLCGGEETDEELFAAADAVRRQYVGDGVHLRGLIEFSNFCRNNCRYCGLRRGNKNLNVTGLKKTQFSNWQNTPSATWD